MTATTVPLSFRASSSNWLEPLHEPEDQRAQTHYSLLIPTNFRSGVGAWLNAPTRTLVASGRAADDLRSVIRMRLGFLAARRFQKLAGYQPGWDGDKARSLSPESAALAAAFIRAFKPFPTKPSLFLTRNGGFALSWDKRTGESIEVIFEDSECRISSQARTAIYPANEPEQIKGIVRALAV